MTAEGTVHEVIGVYDADGSLGGEVAYVIGRLTGRAHCALCDITHGWVRRRTAFDVARAALGAPLTLLHRDERPADVVAVTGDRTPMVIGRTDDGFVVLLTADELERCGSSPEDFFSALEESIAVRGLRLPSWRS